MRTSHRQRPSPPVNRISAPVADNPCNASSRAVNLGAKPLPRPAKKEMHKARLGSHTRGDRETARNAGSRRSRQRERRSRSQENTERYAIAQEQRQRLAAYDGRATGAVSGSRPKPAPTLARASPPARRSPNQAAPHRRACAAPWSKSEGSKFEHADLPISALYGEARR